MPEFAEARQPLEYRFLISKTGEDDIEEQFVSSEDFINERRAQSQVLRVQADIT